MSEDEWDAVPHTVKLKNCARMPYILEIPKEIMNKTNLKKGTEALVYSKRTSDNKIKLLFIFEEGE